MEERILIIQLRQIGDILLTTPCLRAIKKARPRSKLTFLSQNMGRLVLDDNPYLDEHFAYGADWPASKEWRLAKTLRERRFDLVIDFMNNPRSAFYTWMSGALRPSTERVSFYTARAPAYTTTTPLPKTPLYIVREKYLLLKAAGFDVSDATDVGLVLPWFESHTQPFMRLFATNQDFRAAPLKVVLSATHRRLPRRWPLVRYAELADRLTREWGAGVLWLHGPGEETLVDEVMALCKEKTFKAPPTSFREMAALIANCDLFVGNSNGPSHVAVAADVPSLQLHGPTTAVSWCPMSERHQAIQAPNFDRLGEATPIDGITFESVWDKLGEMKAMIEQQAHAWQGRRPRLAWR